MLYWLVDNLLWIDGLLCLAALVLLSLWWSNRRSEYVIPIGVVAALALLLWLLSFVIVTDRQQITNAIYEMAQGVLDRKPQKVTQHLAKDFHFDALGTTLKKADVEQALANNTRAYNIQDFSVQDVNITSLSYKDGLARVEFRLFVGAMGNEVNFPTFVRSEFVLEDGKWRMKTLKFYKGFVDTDQEIRVPVQ